MIHPDCFRFEWLQDQGRRLQVRDLRLLERCIYALALVGRLRHSGLNFVFKGGTSLVLHVHPLRRLSIDVDIACTSTMEALHRALDEVVYPGDPFLRYVHQTGRDREEPPTRHFRLIFNSVVPPVAESHILLDVLREEDIHAETVEVELATDFTQLSASTPVRIPTIDSLLGDKLAAFAPNTIGILKDPPPNRAGDPLEPQHTRVAKQLYDVAVLFDVAHSIDVVRRTYEAIRPLQNGYRGRHYTLEQTLTDTIDAAFWFSQRDLKFGEAHEMSDFLNRGVTNLDSHLVGRGLTIPGAKVAAAKAACLAAMLLNNAGESITDVRQRVAAGTDADAGELLTGRYERLRGLRGLAPEAFSYWIEAVSYLGGQQH